MHGETDGTMDLEVVISTGTILLTAGITGMEDTIHMGTVHLDITEATMGFATMDGVILGTTDGVTGVVVVMCTLHRLLLLSLEHRFRQMF